MKRVFNQTRNKLRKIRHNRVRARVFGTDKKPRLSVFRSIQGVNLQLVDDKNSNTLLSVNSKNIKEGDAGDREGKIAVSYLAGKKLGEMAKEKNMEEVVFDRGGYKYHGRVKAVAEGARDAGLKF